MGDMDGFVVACLISMTIMLSMLKWLEEWQAKNILKIYQKAVLYKIAFCFILE